MSQFLLKPDVICISYKNVIKYDIRKYFLWSPYVIGQTIIFLPCGFYLLLSFFFFLAQSQRPHIGCRGHHRTTSTGYIFATKACIDNRKRNVKQQYLLHMSLQYGELRPSSGWDHFVSFFLIVDVSLSYEDIPRQSCAMVPRWRIFGDFLGPAFQASRVQHIFRPAL